MTNTHGFSSLIQCHNAIRNFDYELAIQWAKELKEKGVGTRNIISLASMEKPINGHATRFLVSSALKELGLQEKNGNDAIVSRTYFHMQQIIADISVRKNLKELMILAVETDLNYNLTSFFQLHYAWEELEELGFNYYYDGADLDNIEQIVKDQAHKWIDKYIFHQDDIIIGHDVSDHEITTVERKNGPFSFLKKFWA